MPASAALLYHRGIVVHKRRIFSSGLSYTYVLYELSLINVHNPGVGREPLKATNKCVESVDLEEAGKNVWADNTVTFRRLPRKAWTVRPQKP